MEETTLSSDLAQGFALKALTGIKKKTRVATDSKKISERFRKNFIP